MTRLGAWKKRQKNTWTYNPGPPLEEGEVRLSVGENGMMATGGGRGVTDDRLYTEEEVKIACEWTLAFMLMFHDTKSAKWGIRCMELSWQYPGHSYRYEFWWAARNICKGYSLEEFRSYLADKFKQIDEGILHRDGPVW